ncbi:MAG TPA: squalene/phytoene synthase family protein, partial [Bradyrhizobium sp.]|nr:squalene/phytoene synthase family protein [Bradyrhizobium sp.]
MSAGEPSKDSAAFCAGLVRTHDFARYASTLFLPAVRRRALLAVYAFNVEISRVRDQVSQPLPGEIRLQWWTDMLEGAGHGEVEGNPVAAELLQVIRDFRLPVEPLSRLIEEHQFDLYNDPMPSMAALEGYVTDTSSALLSL